MFDFLAWFLAFQAAYCPGMPLSEKQTLPVAIWQGTQDLERAKFVTAICQEESQMKVRAWFPEVRPNMDAMGTHNNTLCLELWREGLITDSKDWRKSRQWTGWRRLFQKRPDIGTLIAARAFCRLANKYGRDRAVQMWKTGRTETVPGMLYLMGVRTLADQTTLVCRR